MDIVEYVPTIDGVLESWIQRLGADYAAYRGHVYRVFNYTRALTRDCGRDDELIAIASVFHDLGIWSHATLDYLEPSAELAAAFVAGGARSAWIPTIERMIVMHHKLLPYRGEQRDLVEAFRRADRCDLTFGLMRAGLDRELVRELNARFPDEGFRPRITKLVLRWMFAHPRRPLPMLKL